MNEEAYGSSPAVEALPLMRQQATQDREDLEAMVRGGPEAKVARARFFGSRRAAFACIVDRLDEE